MISIEEAVIELNKRDIESFELSGILVIPVSPKDIGKLDQIAKNMKRIFEEIGYEKSWCLNPYHNKELLGEKKTNE